MAKRRDAAGAAEHKIEEFAEDLGRLLGQAQNKAEGWLNQRQVIVKHLEGVRDTASHLLSQLGHEAQRAAHLGRAARNAVTRRGPGRPKGSGTRKRRTMSAEARKAISDAQKARWAKLRASGRKK